MIRPETIRQITDAARIEEVVGEFVSLNKRGANYIGLCPFHNEKTPSFHVSPSRGIFKCFGCGKGGDSVHFLMEHEHYSYPDALRYLAAKYNIPIEEKELTEEERAQQTERDTLFHVSEFAQQHFADLLYNNELGRNIGLAYFYERGLTDEVIKKFGLGYCLDDWNYFTKYAQEKGYSENALVKSGLTIKTEDGKTYDRFRGRVMFPIFNASGRVLGFSGRVLSSGKQAAKYVNSPDSEIYNKSLIVYGLFQAKNAMSKEDMCYLCEGNVDVISMHQSGIENSVASCGTSLTEEQIRLIKRYTKNITVLYDGDSAGIKAAMRAIDMLLKEGMKVHIVLFPDGDDPDSYAQKYGSERTRAFLKENAADCIGYKAKILLKDAGNDPLKLADAANEMVNTIALVPEMMERTMFVKETASILHIDENTVAKGVAKAISRNQQKKFKDDQKAKEQEQALQNTGTTDTIPPDTEPFTNLMEQPLENADTQSKCSEQELQIIRLLLNYGNRTITLVSNDENGNATEEEQYVSVLIVSDIMNDRLSFENPAYQAIFDIYAANLQEGKLTDENIFITHEDGKIRDLATSLLIESSPSLSPEWSNKFKITVPDPNNQSIVERNLKESMLHFKAKKLQKLIDEKKKLLADPSKLNDDDVLITLSEIRNYEKILNKVSKELNCVIR